MGLKTTFSRMIKCNLFLILFFSLISAEAQEKKPVAIQSEIADVIAQSLYIYKNSLKDTDTSAKINAKKELLDNFFTLDTLIIAQINEYLRYNRNLVNTLDSTDKSLIDSLGSLHNLLTSQLNLFFETGQFMPKKNKAKVVNDTILVSKPKSKTVQFQSTKIAVENGNQLHGKLFNNSLNDIEVYINITDNRYAKILDSAFALKSKVVISLDSLSENFKSNELNLFAIVKQKREENSAFPFTYYFFEKKAETAVSSCLFLITINDSDEYKEPMPYSQVKEIEKHFKK